MNIDVPAVVSQFLSELSLYDLVIELVQNELDAGATRTEIVFGVGALTCSGNGSPIDKAGWERLRYVLGAGSEVAAKQDGIGSKNHGLRSAFLIGDRILVQSNGQRIDLTARGSESRPDDFYPGVWPPLSDPTAPTTGVRITIPYRTRALNVPERNPLEPIDQAVLTSLFEDSVMRSADRFICASEPSRSWRYELMLAHGSRRITFVFSSSPVPRIPRFYLRECKQSDNGSRGRVVARRLCVPFEIVLAADDHAKVPRLFRSGKRILGEISWNVDGKLVPQPGIGGLRYPIAYPREHVSNGWGFDVSGPFISGRARHSLSDDGRNALITQTGRQAFVDLMFSRLVPLHGPLALRLAFSSQRKNQTAEDELARELVEAGAFAVAVRERRRGASKTFSCSAPEMPVLVAAPTHNESALNKDLVAVAALHGQALHAQTPTQFVETLLRLEAAGHTGIERFSEQDAAEAVFIRAPDPKPADFKQWLEHCMIAVRALEIARLSSTLPAEFMRNLRKKSVLPTEDGQAVRWDEVRRSLKAAPPVAGVVPPALLHSSLVKSTIMKEGAGKVAAFNIDEHVSNRNFSNVIAEGRRRFFEWLRKNYGELSTQALAAIAKYPIWPAQDGSFHGLDRYCAPKSAFLRQVIAEVHPLPSDAVVAFPGLRTASNAILRLRTKPTDEELSAWHARRQEMADEAQAQGNAVELQAIVHRTEEVLEFLWRNDFPVAQIAESHQSLSLAGELKEIEDLHIQSAHTSSCSLLDEDIVAGQRSALYRRLGAMAEPSASAILRAFREAPDRSALFSRLRAYRAAGRDLSELSEIEMIELDARLYAPGQLCFPSTTDWWGRWKTPMKSAPDVPDHAALLEQAGVVRGALREHLSEAFFDWLATQPVRIQREHRQQIVRHWYDRRHGPVKWAQSSPEKPCVPVHDRQREFTLLSIKRAQKAKQVFLPDFPEVQNDVLNDQPRMQLAIVEDPRVDGSILDILRAVGVKSLRDLAGQPVSLVTGSGTSSDESLDRELELVCSSEILKTLTKRLPVHDVPNNVLRFGWRQFLREIKGVRIAANLTAIFSVFEREYEIPVQSGFDQLTRKICIDASADRRLAFYAALADEIFVAGSSSLYEYGLMKAVHSQARRTTYDDLSEIWEEEGDAAVSTQMDGVKAGSEDPEAAHQGHGIADEEKRPVAPAPGPLKLITNPTYLDPQKQRRRKRSRPGQTDQKRHSIEEDEQVGLLKEKHYAWHCQACLGERNVLEVAPPRSYVYLPLHRKGLIEAHHVDHLQNNGHIGASNLLILCRFHHQTLGDALSRKVVLQALSSATQVMRNFPVDEDGSQHREVAGLLVDLTAATDGCGASLFFTHSHAASWREVN
ncbi:hypothetical protein ACFPU0_22825 [Pseudomonas sp. GCM10022186]|uniref:hypothetical protein n=1 Tax=Pseudomonas sp. GCM10022186 TaxID=3252650 RepID=UPI00360B9DD4